MKLRSRWVNILGGFIFASGLLTSINSAMRVEGSMIRKAIYSQNLALSKDTLNEMNKLEITSIWLQASSTFMASVDAALVCWRGRDD
jgi:hypothetical protein